MTVFSKRFILIGTTIVAVSLTLAGILIYHKGAGNAAVTAGIPAPTPLPSLDLPETAHTQTTPLTMAEYNLKSAYGPVQDYLSDVDIDGALLMDAYGHLIRSKKIRQLFDFFLMAVNDEGLSVCSGRIKEMITLSLTGEARKEAFDLWESYEAYRLALPDTMDIKDYVTPTEGLDRFESILDERVRLRHHFMASDVVDLFFGDEEAYDRYMLDRIRIQQDDSLSEPEKAKAIRQIIDRLPPSLAEKEIKNSEEQAFEAEIDDLKQSKNTQAVYTLRESRYGSEAAARLGELDKKNEDLERRMKAFHTFKQAITSDPTLAPEEKKRRIHAALTHDFAEWERPMLR